MKSCPHCKARFSGNPTHCPLDGTLLVEMPDPLLGRVIGGRYRVEKKIGAGGMATVYRASYDLLGRRVAIKFLLPELAIDPVQKERFLREARATNRIKHENIVDISDFGEAEGGLVYLVMELLEGEPLAERIARGPLPPLVAVDFMLQMTRALARAHELEVIHRDLKPENIFLVPRADGWQVKLLDFGLAHVRNEVRLTASGAVFGTPEYMSPEQARGAPVGPASDLYALGVVFFEMLTSKLPFSGSTAELIIKHVRAAPPSPSSLMPGLPHQVDAVVLTMLAKDPAKRHRDAHHLAEDLIALREILAPQGNTLGAKTSCAKSDTVVSLSDDLAIAYQQGADTSKRDEHPTIVPRSARTWVERRAAFRAAIEVVYGNRTVPERLVHAQAALEQLVDEAVRLEAEGQRMARLLTEREQAVAESRDRIGRALDQLARDESLLVRQIDELERRAERVEGRAQQMLADFQRAWREALATAPEGLPTTLESALALEAAARRARAWRQALEEAQEIARSLDSRRLAHEDLRFQVSQLKGRMGALNAEIEFELGPLRELASEIGAQLALTQERLDEQGAALAAHLAEFPAARSIISIERGERPPRSA